MIDLDVYNITESTLCEIKDNYKILHFDEYPILFLGSNILGNYVLGSLIEELESDELIFFRSLISSKNMNLFLSKKINYRSILESAVSIFITLEDHNKNILKKYDLNFLDIPNEYLPLESAFCPNHLFDNKLKFSVSLQGAKADIHEAFASSVSQISQSFSLLVDEAFDSINELGISKSVVLEPFKRGSFRLDFIIKIDSPQNIFVKQQEVNNYIAEYIDYVVDDLHTEVRDINKQHQDELIVNKLLSKNADLLSKVGYQTTRETTRKKLVPTLYKSLKYLDRMSEEVGNGFNQIEVIGKSDLNEIDLPIGFIDSSSSFLISKAYDYVSEITKSGELVKLPKQTFRILIYHLNTDTRVGNAYIQNIDDDKKIDKPRIEISGDVDLAESKYTESLHLNKWILVNATAEIKKGKFRRIKIYEEFN